MRKRKIRELITKNNLIIWIVSAMCGIIVLHQLGMLINAVFKIDKIIYDDAFIFGQNVFLRENIFNIVYVSAALGAVVLFVLRKKSGWLLLVICMVWYISTLILFDIECLHIILYRIGLVNGLGSGSIEWSQSFPRFISFASLGNAISVLVDSPFLPQFIRSFCTMLVVWVIPCTLLWLVCLKRIRDIYNISARVAFSTLCITTALFTISYIFFRNSILWYPQ